MNTAKTLFIFNRSLNQYRILTSIDTKIEEFKRTFGYSAEIKCFDLYAVYNDKNRYEIEMVLLIQPTKIVNNTLVKAGEHYTYSDIDVNILDLLQELILYKREFPDDDFDSIWENVCNIYENAEKNAKEKDKKEVKTDNKEVKTTIEENNPKIITPER